MERTGVPRLDKLLVAFMKQMEAQEPGLPEALRQPEKAAGQCGDMSSWFNDWLFGCLLPLPDWADEGESFAGTHFDDSELLPHLRFVHPWTGFPIQGPDDFGYTDRSIRGYNDHEGTLLRDKSGTVWLIDWTAAQYGYSEFPMVQRLEGGQWVREHVRELTPANN